MRTLAHRAEKVVADGRVKRSRERHYDVTSGENVYHVRIEETNTGRNPVCDCPAGRHDTPCHHGLAALMEDTRLSARERAWADSLDALRTLFRIVEDEDTPGLAMGCDPGGDEAVRTVLLEALDRFEEAHAIDTEN